MGGRRLSCSCHICPCCVVQPQSADLLHRNTALPPHPACPPALLLPLSNQPQIATHLLRRAVPQAHAVEPVRLEHHGLGPAALVVLGADRGWREICKQKMREHNEGAQHCCMLAVFESGREGRGSPCQRLAGKQACVHPEASESR